jgi:transmembrane protein TMEM174 (potassium channel)
VSEGRAVEDDEPSTGGSRESDYDVGRLMAFSDGVFAVAITLLVFNVPVPAIAQSDAMSRLPDALLNRARRPY